jgi:hypothetical protein
MSWLLFWLGVLVAMGGFGDFLLGRRGDRAVRAKLADFYVSLEGDWRAAYQAPAAAIVEYSNATFGRRPLVFIIRTALLSAFLSTCISIYRVLDVSDLMQSRSQTASELIFYLALYVLPNIVGDLFAWTLALSLLRKISTAPPLRAIALLACSIPLSIVAVYITILVQGPFVNFLSSEPRASIGDVLSYALGAIELAFAMLAAELGIIEWESPLFNYNGAAPFLVILPLLMFAVATVAGVFVASSRGVLVRPVMFFLERLDEQPKGVLTVSAAGLSVIIGLIAAAVKATGTQA